MTPRQKAEELVRKYYSFGLNNPAQSFSWYECKQCALIAVDEIDLILQKSTPKDDPYTNLASLEYWQEVKKEIENL
jgi:hypothetical protein